MRKVYGVTPMEYVDLKCKREGCNGRVMEDEIYFENGKVYQDLMCLLCSEHYYLTTSEWTKQKKKMEIILRNRKRVRNEQDSVQGGEREVLSSPE